MKNFWMTAAISAALAIGAIAQTSTGAQTSNSTSTNTSVSTGQQGASVNSNTSSDANASTNPQSSSQGSASNSTSTAASTNGAGLGSANSSLASGTTILATLAKSVDAKKAKQGDEVTARAAQNVVSSGSVVIPRGSKLIGHVTEVKAREKGQNESTLGIAFDKAVLKNGQEVPLQATIQSIAAAEDNNAANASPMPDMGSAGMDAGGSANGGMNGDMGPRTSGPTGGATNTVGSAAGTVGNTAGNAGSAAGGAANSTVNGTTRAAGGVTGQLAANSQGVIGLQGLTLNSHASSGSVISSNTKNVKLDSGTQLVLQVNK